MSNNNKFWGKRFGFFDPSIPKGQKEPFGNCMSLNGFGAKPRTNHGNPNKPQTKQSKQDKEKYTLYVKQYGLPLVYFKSNTTKNSEKTRKLVPGINSIRLS